MFYERLFKKAPDIRSFLFKIVIPKTCITLPRGELGESVSLGLEE
jgi:hypothetical protein